MRILFLLQDFPYPPATGINRKVFGLLSYLGSRGLECDVLCFGGPEAAARVPPFEGAIPGVKVLAVVRPASGIVRILKKLLCLLRGLPPSLGGFNSGEFRAALKRAAVDKSYDAVHYDVINMAQYLPWGPPVPSVLSSNDAISLFYERMIRQGPGILRRLYLTVSKYLITRFEREVYPKFDVVHVVSEEDSFHLRGLCPGLAVEVIPIAVDTSFTGLSFPESGRSKAAPRILFTGNLDILGIANGLFEFLEKEYSDLVAETPPFEFYVLGPKAGKHDEKRLSAFHGLKYFKWVEDYRNFLAEADILLALDKSGTGIKTRVLDAMALGKPVVGTRIAFGGIAAENGRDCFICDSPRETAVALKLLLQAPELREKTGKSARQLMLSRYAVTVVGPKWLTLYSGLSAGGQLTGKAAI